MGELVNRLSEKPAKVLGLNTKGKLAVGYDADITIADCGEEYVIDAEKFYSKAKFTPVHGKKGVRKDKAYNGRRKNNTLTLLIEVCRCI